MYRTLPVVALVCLAVALTSCGGTATTAGTDGGSDGGRTATAKTAVEGKDGAGAAGGSERKARRAAPGAKATADGTRPTQAQAGSGCQARLGDFAARMEGLRQALLAGLSYAEYVVRVRAIRSAYESVPVDRLGAACLTGPAADAEDAFNQYLRAANLWGECAATAGCAASEVEGRLQDRWRVAARSLAAASGR